MMILASQMAPQTLVYIAEHLVHMNKLNMWLGTIALDPFM
jgi:hypothetical protein